jgi:hypothetical protein
VRPCVASTSTDPEEGLRRIPRALDTQAVRSRTLMHSVFYIIGVVVVVIAILSFAGLA